MIFFSVEMTATLQEVKLRAERRNPGIGSRSKTKEDFRHIRGAGSFVDDVRLPDMAFASILRSPYPHARSRGIRLTAKQANFLESLGILTSEDVVKMSDPLPQMTVPPASNLKDYPIAVNKVGYVGEPSRSSLPRPGISLKTQ